MICGSGRNVMRIKVGGAVDAMHPACAAKHYAAVADQVAVEPEPAEDRSCRQCDGPIDGTERLFEIDGQPIWLHPECHAHRLRNRGAP
jgi:hypothetical protein